MGEITFRKALEDYKNVYMTYRNFADRTRVEYLNDLDDLVEFLEKTGIIIVEKLELAQVEMYLSSLERRGFADATRKRKTVAIRSFLKFLYHDQYIGSNIAKRLIPPFVDNKTPSFLTEAEYNRLRQACASNVRDISIIELMLQTGIRLSELTYLTVDDVELNEDKGFVRIVGRRGREDRMIPVNEKACKALNSYITERPTTSNVTLFLNRFQKPFSARGIQKMVKNHMREAGIMKGSVHSLRHTFGLYHVIKGTSLATIQEILGHKDSRSTLIYKSLAKSLTSRELQQHAL